MPAGITDANYYVHQLEARLPNGNFGEPLTTPLLNDFTIVSDRAFFTDVAKRIKLAYEIDPNTPTLPGLEPERPTEEELALKQQRGVAASRSRKGAGAVMMVMVATFNEDTARSTYRYQATGNLVPVDPEDAPDSLYARTRDLVEDIFVAAALARLVPSEWTRKRGERQLLDAYDAKKSEAVLPLATFAGRNNARIRNVWLRQLEQTSQGFRYMPTSVKKELTDYINNRPEQYWQTPDLHSQLAGLHRKNTGRHAKKSA